jgi:hypothetical protein
VWQYDPVQSDLDHPTILVVRAEPKAPGTGVLLAQMTCPQVVTNVSTYDASSGRAGKSANYISGLNESFSFELDKLFVWTGIFISFQITNPLTNTSTVQVSLFEG